MSTADTTVTPDVGAVMVAAAGLRTARDGAVLVVTLDRPERLNAIDEGVLAGLVAVAAEARADRTVRAVVLEGAGRAFSSGLDTSLLAEVVGAGGDSIAFRERLEGLQATFTAFETLPVPVVCALHGPCVGGAVELALACDLRVAEPGTTVRLPETRLGLLPDLGGTTRLTRLCGPGVAKDLVLTGRTIGADEALRFGLVSAIGDDARALARERAHLLAGNAPLALAWAKRVIDRAADGSVERSLEHERAAMTELIGSDDLREGVTAAAGRREPAFRGS